MTSLILCHLLAIVLDDPSIVTGMKRTIPFPPNLQNLKDGKVTRVVASDITGDLRTDVALLGDKTTFPNELYFSFSTDVYPTIEQVPSGVCGTYMRDIDVLPRQTGAQALLVLNGVGGGNAGLRSVTFEKIGSEPTKSFHKKFITGSNGWNQALSARMADVDGDGVRDDVIGVSGSAVETDPDILMIRNLESQPVYTSITFTRTPAYGAARQVVPLHSSDGHADRIAVRREAAVQIYETNGTWLCEWSNLDNDYSVEDLRPITCNGEASQRVALVLKPPTLQTNASWSLLAGKIDGSITTTPVLIGDLNGVYSTSGDADGDGDDDLVLGNPNEWTVEYINNEASATRSDPFSSDGLFLYTFAPGAAPENRAEPCLVDLEGDGDRDLAVCDFASDTLVLQRNNLQDEVSRWVGITTTEESDTPYDAQLTVTGSVGNWTQHLEFWITPPPMGTGTYNNVEIRIWRQANETAPADPLTIPVQHLPFTASSWPILVQTDFHESATEEDFGLKFDAIYTYEMRLLKINLLGQIVSAGPTSLFTYNTDLGVFGTLSQSAMSMPNYLVQPWPDPNLALLSDGRNVLFGGFLPSAFAPAGSGGSADHP